jgi:hypothetical protein
MVKKLTPNINFTIAQYIIEPQKTLKKWAKPNVQIYSLSNFEYIYCRNKNDILIKKERNKNIIKIKRYIFYKNESNIWKS